MFPAINETVQKYIKKIKNLPLPSLSTPLSLMVIILQLLGICGVNHQSSSLNTSFDTKHLYV